jgi:hypothetical protein
MRHGCHLCPHPIRADIVESLRTKYNPQGLNLFAWMQWDPCKGNGVSMDVGKILTIYSVPIVGAIMIQFWFSYFMWLGT